VASVYATVNQFNTVSYRVIATTLKLLDLPHPERALIIERWIEIAQVLLDHLFYRLALLICKDDYLY